MSNSTLPDEGTAGDTALSFSDGTDAISDILNPQEALQDEDQAQDDAEVTEVDADEAETEDADAEETHEDAEEDGPEGYSGGKFASDSAKVSLKDGTTLSVEELKRGYISRQYLTRETQALSEAKKSFETQHQHVNQHAQAIAAQRDFLLQAAKQFLPAPPDRAMINTDIFGYQNALADYQEKMGVINQLQQQSQADQARAAQELADARKEAVRLEAQKLTEVMPDLAKPENYQKFWSDTVDTMAGYGFSAEELNESANDHRFYKVFRDLMKYRKAVQQAPKVRENVQGKPKLISGGKRMDPKAKTSREAQARSQKLRQSGSVTDGIAALMDLDL